MKVWNLGEGMRWYLLSFFALLPAPLLASIYEIDEAYEDHKWDGGS
jgi:hypothetical protein